MNSQQSVFLNDTHIDNSHALSVDPKKPTHYVSQKKGGYSNHRGYWTINDRMSLRSLYGVTGAAS